MAVSSKGRPAGLFESTTENGRTPHLAPLVAPARHRGVAVEGGEALAHGVRRATRVTIDGAEAAAEAALRLGSSAARLTQGVLRGEASAPSTAPMQPDYDPLHTPQVEPTVAGAVGALLRRSASQSARAARRDMQLQVAQSLLPDETRILALLSEDSGRRAEAAIRIRSRARPAHTLIEHASSVSRNAAVAAPLLTPVYLNRLIALGLVEVGPRLPELADEYVVLMTDAPVRDAIARAEGTRLRRPTIERYSIALSSSGRELWSEVESGIAATKATRGRR